MLPTASRLTDADSFRSAVRRGARSGSRTLVAHLDCTPGADDVPRVGLVVSKGVGNSVTRNRVKRRLRHLSREHLGSLPGSSVLVIRALPAAGTATSAELRTDLTRCLGRVRPLSGQSSEPVSGQELS
ncbi:MAG: ribonuclease P protein component [Nocardioides sp.]